MKKSPMPGFSSLNTVDFLPGEEDRKVRAKFGHGTCRLMLSHAAEAILQSVQLSGQRGGSAHQYQISPVRQKCRLSTFDPFAASLDFNLSVNCLDLTPLPLALDYAPDMGKKTRPAAGQRLVELRQAAGLTQMQLAERLQVHPSNIAFWELSGTPPRGSILPQMAEAFGVSVDELLGVSPPKPKTPAAHGRLQTAFQAVAKLPRRQQQKVTEVIEALVAQHNDRAA